MLRASVSLTIVARKQDLLDIGSDQVLHEQPSAQVLAFPADVRDHDRKAEEAVAATAARFRVGRLNILVARAAAIRPATARLSEFDRDIARSGYWLMDVITSFCK